MNLPLPGGENHKIACISRFRIKHECSAFSPKLVPRKCKMSVCVRVKCVRVFFVGWWVFFFVALLPPSHRFTRLSSHPSIHPVRSPSHAQQPEEEEDGHKQEEGVLPVVIAVVEVTVALMITCILV